MIISLRYAVLILLIGFSGLSCASGKQAKVSGAANPSPVFETGRASWYGKPFHGRKTASGQRFNMHHMTAAHKTLPFGTVVKVKNDDNQKEVVVKINDRGPFIKGRVIDLSYAAGKKIGLQVSGHAAVSLKVMK